MLRRKLLYNLAPVILLLLITAVAVIWQLESVLGEVRQIHGQTDVLVGDLDDLSTAVNEAELELYKLDTQREKHLDNLIISLEKLEELVSRIEKDHPIDDAVLMGRFDRITVRLPIFTQHLSFLATVQDAILQRQHTEAALAVALDLRQSAGTLSRDMRDVARRGHEDVITRFRWLVLGLSLAFLVLVNVAVVLLLRTASMVLKPVDKLVEATRAIAAGRFDAQVELAQKDEFGELADAYNKMAKQLENQEARRLEIISQIAITMNHELNNAMSIIELQLQLLTRRSGHSPEQEQCLKQIRAGLERMSQTVASLKRIRRIVLTEYLPGTKMVDLTRSTQAEEPEPTGSAPLLPTHPTVSPTTR